MFAAVALIAASSSAAQINPPAENPYIDESYTSSIDRQLSAYTKASRLKNGESI